MPLLQFGAIAAETARAMAAEGRALQVTDGTTFGGVLYKQANSPTLNPLDSWLNSGNDAQKQRDWVANTDFFIDNLMQFGGIVYQNQSTGTINTGAGPFVPATAASLGWKIVSTLDLNSDWDESDHQQAAWAFPGWGAISNYQLATPGKLYICQLKMPITTTISGLNIQLTASGTSLTNSFMAVFDANRNLLRQSVDQSSNWGNSGGTATTGTILANLTSGVSVPQGMFYIGWWSNGLTANMPTFARGTATSACNVGLTGAGARWSVADSGLTTAAPSQFASPTAFVMSVWCSAEV